MTYLQRFCNIVINGEFSLFSTSKSNLLNSSIFLIGVDSAEGVVSLGILLFHFIESSVMLYDCIGPL